MTKNDFNEALVIDIDGTLTPPREPLRREMADALSKLRVPFFVAAGSDLPLLRGQFFNPLKKFKFRGRIEAFLNNGASQYMFDYSKGFSISVIKKFNLRKHLGERHYAYLKDVLKDILRKKEYRLPESIKIIGEHFIDRGSMINFAPFGRPAHAKLTRVDLLNRENFTEFDESHHYRDAVIKYLEIELSDMIKEKNLKILYGGQTSFDILIKGMDKTHPIKMLIQKGYKRIIFIGDALLKDGNDSVIRDFIRDWNGPQPCPVVAVKVETWRNTLEQFRANCWLEE
jgi:phosphomannomutase